MLLTAISSPCKKRKFTVLNFLNQFNYIFDHKADTIKVPIKHVYLYETCIHVVPIKHVYVIQYQQFFYDITT